MSSDGAVGGSHQRDAKITGSPSRSRYDLELPAPRLPNTFSNAGATPIFELLQDPLESARSTPRPHDYSEGKNGVSSIPPSKRRNVNEGTDSSTSSHFSTATPSSSVRHQHATVPHERRASVPALAQASSKRSPSSSRGLARQDSMGRAASQNTHDAVSGRKTPQMAAHTGARPDSANAISRRHVTSPETIMVRQYSNTPTLEDEDTDDEQDKGHGARRQSSIPTSGRWTPTILSGIIKKTASPVYSFSQSASKQRAHTEQEGLIEAPTAHGRKTPAKYQVQEDAKATHPVVAFNNGHDHYPPATHSVSQSYRASHPLSHAHKVSTSTIGSNSSHSIQMQSPSLQSHSRHTSGHTSMQVLSPTMQQSPIIGNSTVSTASSSPLVVPHARRGAINLRPAGRRKKAALARRRRAAALAAQTPKVSLLRQLQRILSVLIKALLCPSHTAHSIGSYLQSTLHGIDMSFRDARTGQRVWKPSWLEAYIPLLIWLVISLSSTISVIIWHTEVFQALDRLSTHLQEMGLTGRLLLGSLIFLTTFPPLPLYSTLIILCGFSFGLVQGFIISYIAALSGAIVVFVLSRSLLKSWMVDLLNKSGGMKRVVRAIEKRPKLLFLVRLAPYPYNLMNTLLASSQTLTLRTYTLCTALALPKLLVHCALGTSIKNFAAYNGAVSEPDTLNTPLIGYDPSTDASSSENAEAIKHIFGFAGVGLCVGIFIYLFSVARKAVDEELDDEDEMDEYGMVLSDEGDENEEDEEEESSDLDHDELSIAAQISNESSKESSMLNRRSSLPASTNIQSAQAASRTMFNGNSDSTLVNGMSQSYSQAGETILFSTTNNNKSGIDYDGSVHQYSDIGPYTYQQGNQSSRNQRHLDSQVSLADSIVEMEKHAVEMEQESLFYQRDYSYGGHTPYLDEDDDTFTEQGSGTLRRK